ncbi:hypothetical protein [Actinospica sp.]|uniref:hypothetical protein n=1 Tax=Actinospica sp. TaxID=1872142 RepID=UPI002C2933A1|nr:hypothetical protein [Actinospica sp.]HWG27389.1 hypothetical protein [Actinospica sp.]
MAIGAGEALGVRAAGRLARLDGRVCRIEAGLTDSEIARCEAVFGFEFADDHRAFLAAGLPVSIVEDDPPGVIRTYREPWPDWRGGDPNELRKRLDWPVEGVLFDVEHNVCWLDEWGERPEDVGQALDVAGRHLADVPKLVPVYGHRYLPSGHGGYGHLVMSVWQTDIICYGADLADYIDREFGAPSDEQRSSDKQRPSDEQSAPSDPSPDPRATVEFWRDFL